ncbi:MAG: GspMb/PilO family protein [Culicoidibacterales bacterium]
MKISKQEQLLLSLVAILVLGIGYYQFGFVPHQQKNEVLKQEKVTLEQKLQEYEEIIATIDTKVAQKQLLALSVSQATTGYYATLKQEQIIIDLNKLMSDHQLSGKIDFSKPTVAGVEATATTEQQVGISTLQQQIEQYHDSSEPTVPQADIDTSTDEQADSETNTAISTTTGTVQQMNVIVAVEGQYEKVQSFIKAIETYNQRIIVTNAQIKALADNNVTASLKLELYAIPSLESEATIWGLTGEYGKNSPFSTLGSAFTQSLITADENKRDFVGIIKSSYSDLASFMLGKANDSSKASYLVDDTNGTIASTLRFSQVDGQYVYSQTVGDQSYPTKGQQEVFTPQSNYIVVELTSEAIIDSRDTTKLALKIENKTDKTVVVFIKNDDEQAPRIQIEGQSETVVVVKQ